MALQPRALRARKPVTYNEDILVQENKQRIAEDSDDDILGSLKYFGMGENYKSKTIKPGLNKRTSHRAAPQRPQRQRAAAKPGTDRLVEFPSARAITSRPITTNELKDRIFPYFFLVSLLTVFAYCRIVPTDEEEEAPSDVSHDDQENRPPVTSGTGDSDDESDTCEDSDKETPIKRTRSGALQLFKEVCVPS
jgi:hypothetical protein